MPMKVRLEGHDEEHDDIGGPVVWEGEIDHLTITPRMKYQDSDVPELISHEGRLFEFCGDGCTSDNGGFFVFHEVFPFQIGLSR